MSEKMKPQTLGIFTGSTDESQKRRRCYERKQKQEGYKSLGHWARETLDKASGYNSEKETVEKLDKHANDF